MELKARESYLRLALRIFGAIFILVYLLMKFWPSGWQWKPNQSEYEQMILGVYAVLGIFMLLVSRKPLQHLSLIWFTVWSSWAHAGIMAAQAMVDVTERGHFVGDIPALALVGIVLAVLAPKTIEPVRVEG